MVEFNQRQKELEKFQEKWSGTAGFLDSLLVPSSSLRQVREFEKITGDRARLQSYLNASMVELMRVSAYGLLAYEIYRAI